jgi:putative SOS response-associated peptidase YedK
VGFFPSAQISKIDLKPRYNIAPTQPVGVVRAGQEEAWEWVALRWGLIPSWAKGADGHKTALVNARAETLAQKPSFRESFRSRRCLVPADGFYEWRHQGRKKQPFFIHKPEREPFAFAGVWDRWINPDGEVIDSCAIVTTTANHLMRPLHERMPVILNPEDFGRWLDPRLTQLDELRDVLIPLPDDALTMYPVNPLVNSSKVDRPECIEPFNEPTPNTTQPSLWAE